MKILGMGLRNSKILSILFTIFCMEEILKQFIYIQAFLNNDYDNEIKPLMASYVYQVSNLIYSIKN